MRAIVVDETAFADEMSFGEVGAFRQLHFRTIVALDPNNSANRAIVDLDRAERSATRTVEAESDVIVLGPADPRRGNGCLLCVVPNRGTTGGMPFNLDGPPHFGAEAGLDPGDGWLLRNGWTLAWIGWQWDVPRGADRLGCSVPEVVDDDGRPIQGTVRVELQPFLVSAPSLPLRSASDLSGTAVCYPAADVDQPDAVLEVATRRGDSFRTVPRSVWRFARSEGSGPPVRDRTSIWLAGGFQPDLVYRARYRTSRCPLVGAGLAVFRDVAMHLLTESDELEHGFAVGWSQSGRFLRQFLADGFNVDEMGQQVFDAVLPFIAGVSYGEFNCRYGQPSEALAEGSSLRPPFAFGELVAVDRLRGTAPKVVTVDTASEYWRGDGSLAHIDDNGRDRSEFDSDTRAYYLAGTEHLGGAPANPTGPGIPRNFLPVSPISRAVLELVRKWVVDGIAPPPSRRPRISDGTAIPRKQALDRFAAVTGLVPPEESALLSPSSANHELATTGCVYVAALDEDANEVAGIRHPELSVPMATHTGWNLVLAQGPQWASLGSVTGNSLSFPRELPTTVTHDRRQALSGRYRDVDDYLAQVAAAATLLMAEGFLLADDLEAVIATAHSHYLVLTEVGPD
ncbi:MAG: alpha/beta hydrolase domain-containing protein [Acidimicrobiales bacterium]